MGVFHAKPVEVRAEQFNRNQKPYPDAVEIIYAEGIPRPVVVTALGNIDLRSGDWIVSTPHGFVVIPDRIFLALFDTGKNPVREHVASPTPEVPLIDLDKVQADLTAVRPSDIPEFQADDDEMLASLGAEKEGGHGQ